MDTKKHIKICKKCHHIIDEQTIICPYCNKKQISSLKYGLKMFFGYFFAFASFVYIVEAISNNETELFFALIITAIISILFFRSAKKDKKVKKHPLAKRKSNNTYSTNSINYTATQNSNDCITESESMHQRTNNQTLSIADEIIKLKKLLDSGAITQEEFDRQKEKLFST